MKPSAHLSSRATINRAHKLLDENRHKENLELLEAAVERYPEDAEIRLLYGTALVPARPQDAPRQLAEAIALDPDDPARLTRAASILYYLGETEAARSYAARATQLAQEGFALAPDLTNLGGKLALLQGDDALAEDALATAVELCPERPDFAYDLAAFLIARGRTPDAISVIERALAGVDQAANERDARDVQRLTELRKSLP
jgi:Flp pilus assembly protein TadD